MFNPKQALERIRRQKVEQEERTDPLKNSINDRPLFPQFSKISVDQQPASLPSRRAPPSLSQQPESLQQRMAKLQALVSNLNQKLTQSNQTITHLKDQNSQLQAQVLKLSHENAQLKTAQTSQSKTNLAQRLNHSISGLTQNHKVLTSLSNQKSQIRKTESKVIQDQIYSHEVQDAIEEIKKQPLQNILKRREHNFRALKNASKQTLAKGEKALRELANLHKEYGKNYKKPTLILNLTDADFE